MVESKSTALPTWRYPNKRRKIEIKEVCKKLQENEILSKYKKQLKARDC